MLFRAGYEIDRADAVLIPEIDENEVGVIFWKYGDVITTAGEIENPHNHFIRRDLVFEKMER